MRRKLRRIGGLEPVDKLPGDLNLPLKLWPAELGSPRPCRDDHLFGRVRIPVCDDAHRAASALESRHRFMGVDDRTTGSRHLELRIDGELAQNDTASWLEPGDIGVSEQQLGVSMAHGFGVQSLEVDAGSLGDMRSALNKLIPTTSGRLRRVAWRDDV